MIPRIAVLGAGIQGTCTALELAARGFRVDLYDRNATCCAETSLQGEGKIHLGFVYANDPSRHTVRKLAQGALTFAPFMRRWLGAGFDRIPLSSPFLYAVNRTSLLGLDEIRDHFAACVDIASELGESAGLDYFGRDFRQPVRELPKSEWRGTFNPGTVVSVFETNEIAVDPEAIATLANQTIVSIPEITLRFGTRVRRVDMNDRGGTVAGEASGSDSCEHYDHVVNALWSGRVAVDHQLGHPPPGPWLWRMRHSLRVSTGDTDRAIPSVTNILGPFGDVVNYGNGDLNLSWYPSGRTGTSQAISPPAEWRTPLSHAAATAIETGTFAGLSDILPAIGELERKPGTKTRVTSGVVYALGTTDIDDRESGLHNRYDIGVQSHGRYHSIDTGKYTTAPLFATEVAARIAASA